MLRDRPGTPRFIETVRAKGYRFIAPVQELNLSANETTRAKVPAVDAKAGEAEKRATSSHQGDEGSGDRSSNPETIIHLTESLELLKATPESAERDRQELKLQMALGGALMTVKGYGSDEGAAGYIRALELCRQMGETSRLFPVLGTLSVFYLARGEGDKARAMTEQLLHLAENLKDPVRIQAGHFAVGSVLYTQGEFVECRTHLERAVALYDPNKRRFSASQDPGVGSLWVLALALLALNYIDQAVQKIHQAVAWGRELPHPFNLAEALCYAAEIHHVRREVEQTQAQAQTAITVSLENRFKLQHARAVSYLGWALVKRGLVDEGLTQIRQGIAETKQTGGELWRPALLGLLSEACVEALRPDEGLAAVAEALKSGLFRSELCCLKGQLLLLKGPSCAPVAEESFRFAIGGARKRSMKLLELRVATNLTRLLASQGRHAEGRSILSEVYRWFTEGFETAPLKKAATLLQELGTAG